jgi:hypothetical protein
VNECPRVFIYTKINENMLLGVILRRVKKKVKQSLYRPGVAQRVPGS